ncbi:oligosaccharide flippase family protein [Flavobacteriaceae bacterium]|nr:oligosaccharide flippase family protein [Flavobacteriaceae bacterium]
MNIEKVKKIIRNNSVIFENFSYIALLELFVVLSPFFTYPYLIKTLGSGLYGLVITAQVIASYGVIVVNFGLRSILPKHISIHRDDKTKLSEIISSAIVIRALFWVVSFIIFYCVIITIPKYNEHLLLFILSFGITFNDLLFPQFYFHGIEKMKFITFINIGINTIFILLIFLFVKDHADYYLVPLFKSIGFFLGGIISLYIIFFRHNIKFRIPKKEKLRMYMKESLSIFSTEIITSIKDKLSYILIGSFVGMSEVVIYDLGAKFTAMLVKPITILSRVLFPKIAKERNILLSTNTALVSFILMTIIIIVFNLFLPYIVKLFLSETINLMPLRIFSLAPLFLSVSSFIATNSIIAFGFNKYIFYSIIVTTAVYVTFSGIFYFSNSLNTVTAFVIISVVSYLAELIYRVVIAKKITKKLQDDLT